MTRFGWFMRSVLSPKSEALYRRAETAKNDLDRSIDELFETLERLNVEVTITKKGNGPDQHG